MQVFMFGVCLNGILAVNRSANFVLIMPLQIINSLLPHLHEAGLPVGGPLRDLVPSVGDSLTHLLWLINKIKDKNIN